MANYLTINKSITEMSAGERLLLIRNIRHLREVSTRPRSKASQKRSQKKKDTISIVQSMQLDDLIKLQKALKEQMDET